MTEKSELSIHAHLEVRIKTVGLTRAEARAIAQEWMDEHGPHECWVHRTEYLSMSPEISWIVVYWLGKDD